MESISGIFSRSLSCLCLLSNSSSLQICVVTRFLSRTPGTFIKVPIHLHDNEQGLLSAGFIYERQSS